MGVLINNNRTTALERTTALVKGGVLNAFYWYQIFSLDSAVDEAQNVQLAWMLQAAKTTVTSHKVQKGGKDKE